MSDVGFASPIAPLTKNGQLASYGNDSGLLVTFYKHKLYMEAKSVEAGRPIYEWRDYVHIVMPGGKSDLKREIITQVPQGSDKLTDMERFPRQWQAYQNQQEQVQTGTPIEDWSPLPREIVDDFKACRIHTVESLANLTDANAHNMPLEWRKWRDKAIMWLEQAEKNAPILALKAENDQLKADMEALKQQFALIGTGQSATPVKRRGRPPKNPQPPQGEAA